MKSTNERCNDIENKLVKEKKKRSKRTKLIASLSVSLAVVLTLGLVLFIPYPTYSIDAYKDSEYYPLIQRLEQYRPKRDYKNNFERLQLSLQHIFAFGAAKGNDMSEAPTSSGSAPMDAYEEVTDNQVAGVVEGDLFKRSTTTAYYLSWETGSYYLDVYPLAGLDTACSARIEINPEQYTRFSGYEDKRELFLNENATRATIVTPCYNDKTRALYTAMISVDLTTKREIGRTYFAGNYVSSRLVDGNFLLVSNFSVRGYDFDDQSQYLPQYGSMSDLKSIPMSDIVLPESISGTRYTVLYSVEENGLDLVDSLALMSYSDEVYVSEENVYATLAYSSSRLSPAELEAFGSDEPSIVTTITQVGYKNGLTVKNSCLIGGTVNDRYSLDEYEGVFRVVTSVSGVVRKGSSPYAKYDYYQSANLYCFDAENFDEIARVEKFAPNGEQVMSARFKGDKAYVCTAIEYRPAIFNDPVFAFDLSDYDNITGVDTGTIPGYSLFLSAFVNDTLIGIGYGDGGLDNLKIEIYEETETSVEPIAAFERVASFANDYKAYYIDRVNGRIGLGLSQGKRIEYCLLQFDGYNLIETVSLELLDGYDHPAEQRAFILDDVLYVFCPSSGIHTIEI